MVFNHAAIFYFQLFVYTRARVSTQEPVVENQTPTMQADQAYLSL